MPSSKPFKNIVLLAARQLPQFTGNPQDFIGTAEVVPFPELLFRLLLHAAEYVFRPAPAPILDKNSQYRREPSRKISGLEKDLMEVLANQA